MRELRTLDKTLLKSEFDLAKAIYDAARNDGYSAIQSAAICYRHGLLDGNAEAKHWRTEYHKLKHAKSDPVSQANNSPLAAESEDATHE